VEEEVDAGGAGAVGSEEEVLVVGTVLETTVVVIEAEGSALGVGDLGVGAGEGEAAAAAVATGAPE
jgi:hypothetical protein